ncbi:hypothetical protein D1007_58190 [Hordeum vulgare]|nr:hypothetical protein D1007_58190 [Hordeum vulgare]
MSSPLLEPPPNQPTVKTQRRTPNEKKSKEGTNRSMGWDLGAQTAKGLSADAAEEAGSETLVHKFVITAAETSHRPSRAAPTRNRCKRKSKERCVYTGGGRRAAGG